MGLWYSSERGGEWDRHACPKQHGTHLRLRNFGTALKETDYETGMPVPKSQSVLYTSETLGHLLNKISMRPSICVSLILCKPADILLQNKRCSIWYIHSGYIVGLGFSGISYLLWRCCYSGNDHFFPLWVFVYICHRGLPNQPTNQTNFFMEHKNTDLGYLIWSKLT